MSDFYDRLGTISKEMEQLVREKNMAYGNSFAECEKFFRILYPKGLQPHQYGDALLLVRVFDKMMRIATYKEAFDESPWRDIIGYGLLGAAIDESTCPPQDAGGVL